VSVQITNDRHVFRFCDTADVAFGPMFSSIDEAEDFLAHLESIGERDPRIIPAVELAELHSEWEDENS